MEIDIKTVVGTYAQVTLFLLMLSIGLREGFGNISLLWKQPSLLVRCLVASFVLVPLAAMAIDAILPLNAAARMGLGAMAICPGAPMLYRKLAKKNANPALAGSFQVTVSLFAILVIPVWIALFNVVYAGDNSAPVAAIAKQVATVQLIPILLGLSIRQWLPRLADDLLEPVEKISSFLLLGILVVVVIVAFPKISHVGLVNSLGIALFVAATFVIGHFLGGGDPETRISMALANSTRNAGLALALVSLNVKDSGPVLGVIGATAFLAAVAGAVYTNLYRKRLPSAEPAAGAGTAPES